MSLKSLLGCAMAAACAAALAGCPGSPGSKTPKDKNVIGVYAKAAGEKTLLGSVAVSPEGALTLSVEKEGPGAEALRKAVAALQSRKALKLSGEKAEKIDGKDVVVFKEFAVMPGEPLYKEAVAYALKMEFGLDARLP